LETQGKRGRAKLNGQPLKGEAAMRRFVEREQSIASGAGQDAGAPTGEAKKEGQVKGTAMGRVLDGGGRVRNYQGEEVEQGICKEEVNKDHEHHEGESTHFLERKANSTARTEK